MDIDLTPILTSRLFLLRALWMTLLVSGLSMGLGFAIGIVVGTLRTYGGRAVDAVLGFYVDSMRAMPLLVILIWTKLALPLVIGVSISTMTAAVLALSIHLGAYVAEVIRAGLSSVRRGQMYAALALGMSPFAAIRTIILPQALIRMLPPMGSLFIFAIKDSAIAGLAIGVPELMRQSQVVVSQVYHQFEIYTVLLIVYFLLCYPVARSVDRIYRRVAHLGSS